MTPEQEERWLMRGVYATLILTGTIAIYGAAVNFAFGRVRTAVVFILLAAPALSLLFFRKS